MITMKKGIIAAIYCQVELRNYLLAVQASAFFWYKTLLSVSVFKIRSGSDRIRSDRIETDWIGSVQVFGSILVS